MNEAELKLKIEALEKDNRILRQKLETGERNMAELEETLETHSNALKARNQELEESKEKLKASEARYRKLALYDALTALPNRSYFHLLLDKTLSAAKDSGRNLALLFLDLDRFKEINDRLGHRAGDAVLVETARRLLKSIRDNDIVARLGGDEFAAILPDIAAPADAESIARRIVETLSAPLMIEGNVCQIGVSVGISQFPVDTDDSEKLLQFADSAMYSVKKASGFNYRFFQV
jgi:diguanylate cyclase (GGDEF)-like protein